ncbi:hypothetical protein HXX01_03050, partial [Candidatus Nomurabacteria bacterium]|nr:hypothetical protein [Candidatus Nomurabacteria bacterium]
MSKDKREGYGKILDCWSPPKDAGTPVGCLSTTYTFDPELYEEDCLSRFLQMKSDFNEDSVTYLIEREERLSNISCAAVLVDKEHSNKRRNPRWDLISMRYRGTFHPKVTVIYWSGCIRLMVGSANLTKAGYRENQEIFCVVDFAMEQGKFNDKK